MAAGAIKGELQGTTQRGVGAGMPMDGLGLAVPRTRGYATAPGHGPAVPASMLEGVWSDVCAALGADLGPDLVASWIAPARLIETPCDTGPAVAVVTQTETARDWIRRNAWRQAQALWAARDPQRRPLLLISRAEAAALTPSAPAPAAGPEPMPTGSPASTAPIMLDASAPESVRGANLQARFTFDSFVPAPSNEFALSVARKVAHWAEGGCFDAVVIHGPYGFGKTHLLNAIGWEAQRTRPGAKVVYLTAEQFLNTFVAALRVRDSASFKDSVRSADLLLIDDVQFIGGKKSSQEEMFHTLIALMSEGKRVVFSADRPPAALSEVDARLRSHLSSGLICGIEAADRDLRLGVIRRKLALLAEQLGVEGSAQPEVMALLADRFPDSIRELEGGLNTLAVRAGERLSTLTAEEAEGFLRPHLQRGGDRKVTVDEIQKAVADHYLLKQADLLSERRTRAVARPRQLAMYLAKSLTTRSYPDIGRRFGGRDHTTVLHAVRRIEALKAEDPVIAADLEAVTRKLRG